MEYRHQCPRLLSLDSSGMSWTRSLLSVYTLNRLWDVLQNTRGDSKKKLRLSKIQKEKMSSIIAEVNMVNVTEDPSFNMYKKKFLVASILFINPKELGLIPGFVRKLVKLRPLSRLCDEVRDLSYLFEDVLTPAGQTQLEQLNEVCASSQPRGPLQMKLWIAFGHMCLLMHFMEISLEGFPNMLAKCKAAERIELERRWDAIISGPGVHNQEDTGSCQTPQNTGKDFTEPASREGIGSGRSGHAGPAVRSVPVQQEKTTTDSDRDPWGLSGLGLLCGRTDCRIPTPSQTYLNAMAVHQKFIMGKWIGMLKGEILALRKQAEPSQRMCGLCSQSFWLDHRPKTSGCITAAASSARTASTITCIKVEENNGTVCCSHPGPASTRVGSAIHPNNINIHITFPGNPSVRAASLRVADNDSVPVRSSALKTEGEIPIARRHNASDTAPNRPFINLADSASTVSVSSTKSSYRDPEPCVPLPNGSWDLDSRSASTDISQTSSRSSLSGNGESLMPTTRTASTASTARTHIIYPDSDVEMYVETAPNPILISSDSSEDGVTRKPAWSSGGDCIPTRSRKASHQTEKRQHLNLASDTNQNRMCGHKRKKTHNNHSVLLA